MHPRFSAASWVASWGGGGQPGITGVSKNSIPDVVGDGRMATDASTLGSVGVGDGGGNDDRRNKRKDKFDKYTTLMNTNDDESKHIDD